ncbi:peptide chain release factor 3 [Corallococcus aberystwythensis]|uniref:Peptide chain release factor 3 n=1 Tax=Corallococcus aberystwythensis TaxID=2316722 RepID=A0A3A8QCD5_9BACT|nr:peptide chain release factor 3 [Corallococcus aberystwythensis]RKH65241.1 peptide chain release factor 3 [Corallococcus aberystwythensis]
MANELEREVARRRTFAIISHPDAGKTTLTEKLLLYGGAIHLAGSVKAKRARRHATSDWMELEKERGISVTSSVLQFAYRDHAVNLLDTPGHQDFSEDTYRTLSAADAAVMLIDAAKGVEPQTKKLFKVCRMRGIPIFTFVNKLDRYGREPLELMNELEQVLGIRSYPMNWPIGMGPEFRGVYDRQARVVHVFSAEGSHGESEVSERSVSIDSPEIKSVLTDAELEKLNEDIELLDIGGDAFTREKSDTGQLTPMFFGSAMTNFGVRPFLDAFLDLAPAPTSRPTTQGPREPTNPKFAGFVFKIQANMDPAHRDRIAFMRVVSGRYVKGMNAFHSRLGKEVRLAKPSQFLAAERTSIEDAWPGDVIGLFDPGQYRIGDSLAEGSQEVLFEGVPRFSPEFFAVVRSRDPLRRKQMEKGLEQLSEEGTVQIFQQLSMGMKDPIVGVVGALQFEVLQYRLEHEYGAKIALDRLPFSHARWVVGANFDPKSFDWEGNRQTVQDRDGLPLVLFRDDWALQHAEEKHPDLKFLSEAPLLRQGASAATGS